MNLTTLKLELIRRIIAADNITLLQEARQLLLGKKEKEEELLDEGLFEVAYVPLSVMRAEVEESEKAIGQNQYSPLSAWAKELKTNK